VPSSRHSLDTHRQSVGRILDVNANKSARGRAAAGKCEYRAYAWSRHARACAISLFGSTGAFTVANAAVILP
jgi:hypothetical protein